MLSMRKKRGQSIQEFAILVAAVATAVMAMQVYVRRSMAGRLKDISAQISSKEYNPSGTTSTTQIDRTFTSNETEAPEQFTLHSDDSAHTVVDQTVTEE